MPDVPSANRVAVVQRPASESQVRGASQSTLELQVEPYPASVTISALPGHAAMDEGSVVVVVVVVVVGSSRYRETRSWAELSAWSVTQDARLAALKDPPQGSSAGVRVASAHAPVAIMSYARLWAVLMSETYCVSVQ